MAQASLSTRATPAGYARKNILTSSLQSCAGMTNKIADMFIPAGVSIGVGARERANCVAYSFADTVRSYMGLFAVILHEPCRIIKSQ